MINRKAYCLCHLDANGDWHMSDKGKLLTALQANRLADAKFPNSHVKPIWEFNELKYN